MTNEKLFQINNQVQEVLNKLPFEALVTMTASELHEIWKQTTYIKDKDGNITGQVEKWKKLDPNDSPEEKAYIEKILKNDMFLKFPFVRKNDDGTISIDIAKMSYKQLSPHWQKENKEAAEVAVELTLDNLVYLADETKRDVLVHVIGSAIHLLWKNRPANAYAKNTELGQRYSNISYEEKMKDVRHIYTAEKAIDAFIKNMGLEETINNIYKNNSTKR